MKIGIPLSSFAYTPEAYAYAKYFKLNGHKVQLDYHLDPNNDVNIYFMGLYPFWRRSEGKAIQIHEYQSLSTPPFANVKNFTKKIINKKPSGRIFLNKFVYNDLNFSDNIPYIYRDMGVDEALFQSKSKNPLFDIVYCGSVSGRAGLIKTLLDLSNKYTIVIVGEVSKNEKTLLQKTNIHMLGRVSRNELPEIYRNAHFGLNYTPDHYPFNIQTSTKTLEYLASGLHVISNRYKWAEDFFKTINYEPIWLDQIESKIFPLNEIPSMHAYKWDIILNEVNLNNYIEQLVII